MSSYNEKARGRPKVDSERIDVRVSRPVLDALDDWISRQTDALSRPEAVRRLLAKALRVKA